VSTGEKTDDVLVIGAGIAGMEAALLLAEAGRRVHLVERTSVIGGMVIKCEEVFANMECATCMVSPKQQAVLQNDRIELITLGEVVGVSGSAGDFAVKINQRPAYVDPVNCIGCAQCFEACPVKIPNEFEERLGERAAISVPCAGALPNVPYVDTEHCVRFTKGEDCTVCQEACVFEAIDFSQEGGERELRVAAIVVATGFEVLGGEDLKRYGYGDLPGVYTAHEFERLFASNGPTGGELLMRDGKAPESAAVVHCVGRDEKGYCSGVCCMYSLKFAHYFKKKLPETRVVQLYRELSVPGKSYQRFCEQTREHGAELVRALDPEIAAKNGKVTVSNADASGGRQNLDVDMVVLSPALIPGAGTEGISQVLDLPRDGAGFLAGADDDSAPVCSPRQGVYVAGCARGPVDIQGAVAQAEAAVARVLTQES
jgi:heterodisulfide reductase subunit A